MPILPNLEAPAAAGPGGVHQRTVRLFPSAPGAQGGELPLLQRKVHLAQAPLDARPQGVARPPPPEAHGGLGSPAAREHARKHFTHLVNVGSQLFNPSAADFTGTRPLVERVGPIAAEADFLHPCVGRRRRRRRRALSAAGRPGTPSLNTLACNPQHTQIPPSRAATATCGGRRRTASRTRRW